MTATQSVQNFVYVERPIVAGVCPQCVKPIKHGNADAYDWAVWALTEGYQVETIYVLGGRSFEKVSSQFIHVCSQPAATEPNSLRNTSIGQLALL